MSDGALFARPRAAWFVLALCAYLLFAGLGERSIEVRDISRTAEIARETLEQGRWLAPTREGELETEKPPLYVWAVAALGAVTGRIGALESRLPSALASFGSVLLVFFYGRARRGLATGALAAAFLTAGQLFVELARISRVDSTFAFFLAVSAVAAHEADRPGRRLGTRFGLAGLSGAAITAAMLAKSPLLAVVLHLAAVGGSILADVTIEKPWRQGGSVAGAYLRRLLAPGAAIPPVLALALFACWFVPFWSSLTEHERERTWLQFRYENLDRAASGVDKPQRPWYYVPRLLGQAAPGSLLALFLVGARLARRPGLPAAPEPAFERFVHSWWVFPFLVLSIATGKQVRYLLPCLPGVALAAAEAWRLLESDGRPAVQRARAVVATIAGAGFALAVVGMPVASAVLAPDLLDDACWLALVAAGGAALAWRAGATGALEVLLLAIWLGQVGYAVFVLPSEAIQRARTPVKQLVAQLPDGLRNPDLVVFQIPKEGDEGETRQRKLRLLLAVYREGLPRLATTADQLMAELEPPGRVAVVEQGFAEGIAPVRSALETLRTIEVPYGSGTMRFELLRRKG